MNLRLALLILPCLLSLADCETPKAAQPAVQPPSPWSSSDQWEQDVQRRKVDANLYPQATKVILYANRSHIFAGAGGDVPADSFPKGGVELTPAEIEIVKHAFYYEPPPPVVAGCCIPRHAFFFYDRKGQYLGGASVCFECGCAGLSDEKPPSGLNSLGWNGIEIERIVRAHNLPIHFDR
jgi:hypothetical protein